ncbi:hypothetical protein Y032_0004g1849 [Ancylostoma ceylanicum]|uniref:Uncharacterized protein n=1 Tax=Ancylostoma ceylanicum TaxID=53326 RepID=A0A016VTK0_9BILA|nr:hypothetical protein Y032_0004g1849 [Ancylostoma ceylanicum]
MTFNGAHDEFPAAESHGRSVSSHFKVPAPNVSLFHVSLINFKKPCTVVYNEKEHTTLSLQGSSTVWLSCHSIHLASVSLSICSSSCPLFSPSPGAIPRFQVQSEALVSLDQVNEF